MKTILSTLMVTLLTACAAAQDVTTVSATSGEISDNLDLRAVASIFGDAANLEDFERKLNDPALQISNLDLNGDNQVDYLRVIESVQGGTHLIILQSVLARDVYQDVATIEVERDAHNNIQVQVVGDVYMYGPNYIYEPVYVTRPVIFTTFWVSNYHPYCSTWYWGYYPSYYYAWHPYPVFRYRRNVHTHINVNHHYNYVNVRRSQRAVAMYSTLRSDGYARQYPTRSFAQRHSNVTNRYELDQRRNTRDVGVKNSLMASNTRTSGVRTATRTENNVRNNGAVHNSGTPSAATPRANTRTEGVNANVRNTREANTAVRSNPVANNSVRTRDNQSVNIQTPSTRNEAVRAQPQRENNSTRQTPAVQNTPTRPRVEAAQRSAPRVESATRAPRMETPRGNAGGAQSPGGRAERSGGAGR